MTKRLKDAWVKALRSGKYAQCQGAVEENSAFCCLGVLGIVAGKDPATFNITDDALNGISLGPKTKNACIKVNDEKGWNFKRIATWLSKRKRLDK